MRSFKKFNAMSSFATSTLYFDACIRLFLDADDGMMALVPINQVKRLVAVSPYLSTIKFNDGTEQTINLPLAELHERLQKIDSSKDVIDLSAASLPRVTADDSLTSEFNKTCQGRPGIDYLTLRCYAAEHKTPHDCFEMLARYPITGLTYFHSYAHDKQKTFVEFRNPQGWTELLLVKMNADELKKRIQECFKTRTPLLDIRADTKIEFAPVKKDIVFRP